jgi:hypothetical protein
MDNTDLSLLEEFLKLAKTYGVQRLSCGPYSVEFQAADPSVIPFLPEQEAAVHRAATQAATKAPNPYDRMFGGRYPSFAKEG